MSKMRKIFYDQDNLSRTQRFHGHDSAVLLVTPGLARLFNDDTFAKNWVNMLSLEKRDQPFHLVSAVVDSVSSTGSPDKKFSEGISMLSYSSGFMLPELHKPATPRAAEDKDAVAALKFDLENSTSVTVPLTRTIFLNGKPSTLITSRYDLSGSSPQLLESRDEQTQHISLPWTPSHHETLPEMSSWLPMLPITPSRTVAESFGNILRRVEVDGASAPASSELEEAVAKIQEQLPEDAPRLLGVWALVRPKSAADHSPGMDVTMDFSGKNINQTSAYMGEQLKNGARIYKLRKDSIPLYEYHVLTRTVSGGGGWGNKKGLLSLDPQTSHFAPTEEEEMQSLFGFGGESSFAPPGSEVQFFVSVPAPPASADASTHPHLFFGVQSEDNAVREEGEGIELVEGQFGALSDHAIYISGGQFEPFKLSVPGSLLRLPQS